MTRDFTKDEAPMVSRHVIKCSGAPATREMLTSVRSQLTLVRMATIQKIKVSRL